MLGCDIFIAGYQQHGSSHHYRGKESYFSLLHLERHDHDERPNLPHQPPGEASRWPWAPVREGAKRVSRSGAIIERRAPPGPTPYGGAAVTLPIFFENGGGSPTRPYGPPSPFSSKMERECPPLTQPPSGVLREAKTLGGRKRYS